jgi:hypothetical protein
MTEHGESGRGPEALKEGKESSKNFLTEEEARREIGSKVVLPQDRFGDPFLPAGITGEVVDVAPIYPDTWGVVIKWQRPGWEKAGGWTSYGRGTSKERYLKMKLP